MGWYSRLASGQLRDDEVDGVADGVNTAVGEREEPEVVLVLEDLDQLHEVERVEPQILEAGLPRDGVRVGAELRHDGRDARFDVLPDRGLDGEGDAHS